MKAIDHHLYLRGRYFYYRCALPRNLHEVLTIKEIVIALGTHDLAKVRLYVAKLDIEIQTLFEQAYDHDPTPATNFLINKSKS